jgi:hypothetical protein
LRPARCSASRPKWARTTNGVATDKTAGPTDAEGYSRRGAVPALTGRLKDAPPIGRAADLDRAAMAPNVGRHVHQPQWRGWRVGRCYPCGRISTAIALVPTDSDARIVRGRLGIGGGDLEGARSTSRQSTPRSRRCQTAG